MSVLGLLSPDRRRPIALREGRVWGGERRGRGRGRKIYRDKMRGGNGGEGKGEGEGKEKGKGKGRKVVKREGY